jgi:DNA-binding response OmpR family regulator
VDTRKQNASPGPAPTVAGSPMARVLVVEDDPMFARMLEREGIAQHVEMVVCRNEAEVVAALKRQSVDVAILDYYLEESTGDKTAALLNQDIPVILVSAVSPAIDWLRSLQPSGIRSFLPKQNGAPAIVAEAISLLRRAPIPKARAFPWKFIRWREWIPLLLMAALLLGLLAGKVYE